jgi:hypothetical protein
MYVVVCYVVCLRKASDQYKKLVGSLQLIDAIQDNTKIDCLMSFMNCYRSIESECLAFFSFPLFAAFPQFIYLSLFAFVFDDVVVIRPTKL